MPKRDYYDILGIARSATPELVRAAHRVQSRRYHPDTADDGKGDARLFAEIQEAYETLSNTDNRRRYDTKEGLGRGEYSAGGKRRPPKSACGVCAEPVYASQLKLYLGRHMCRECFDRKREREANRPRLTGTGELIWKLKRFQVWAQSHVALLVVIILAASVMGYRLATYINAPKLSEHAPSETPVTNSADPVPTAGSLANPCVEPTLTSTQTADVRSTRSSER